MKSIPLSTGLCVAILSFSLPTHAETAPFSDPLLQSTPCDACPLSSSELKTLDFRFSHSPTVQIKQTTSSLRLSNSSEKTSPVKVQATTAQSPNSEPVSSSETRPAITTNETTHSLTSRSSPSVAPHPTSLLSPPTLISQATTPRDLSLPPSISKSAADLAQVDSVPSVETDVETNQGDEDNEETETPRFSPLANQQFQQPTAIHLPKGVVAMSLSNRLFFLPGTEAASGTAAYPNFGVTWGITDSTELDLTLQVVDTGTPDRLGPFGVVRRVNNRDLTLSVKQRLWDNADGTLAFSGSFSLAVPLTKRTFEFNPGRIEQEDSSLIPALQFPFTATVSDRWQFTLSPTIAFFPDSNAVFIPRPPLANPGSFGTTFGLSGAISYQVHPRITLWGDAFVPFTGNNSFNRDSGLPAKSIAYNAGLRYFLNPSLGLDIFASNTFGSKGPLALTADRDLTALGLRVISLPSLLASNRRIADSFNRDQEGQDSPNTIDGLAFFDGGTVPSQRFLFHLQGGGQGIQTALRYGVTKDFELSAYLDYIFGEVDESEQGFGVKLRLLNQDEAAPLTASAAVTVGLTNNIFDNFDNNNRNGLLRRGAQKDFPLIFRTDSPEGRRFVVTLSLPLHYKVNDQLAVWFTPIAGFVQREGVELGGFNVGSSVEVVQDLSLVGELGANFLGEGNAFIGNTLADRIPWSVAVRWNPRSIIGGDKSSPNQPNVEFFVTNRVGSSTWHQLRVRDQNEITVGAGISIPF
ncbi:hypothetical protein [Acaryochloris sp. IP29b_bin.137]|uniref:hypothetical protein n=1 Tax=Acaryochloris sp. IP29b_bin.137 TaxID=2969217 RepID=UPI002613434F|nr:hypothetical protein [Acaryochloris sp. IP29b_bin.137]